MLKQTITRRTLLATGAAAAATLALPSRVSSKSRELTVSRIVIQEAKGRRLSPIAPNAYAPYRGYQASERVLRIKTAQGLEGICRPPDHVRPETLHKLIGLDPFKLFQFGQDDRITGAAEPHATLLKELWGCDIALVDLIAKALQRPAASLLGAPIRDAVLAYDGSVYMEDLLKREEKKHLPFINGAMPTDPIELAVRKAQWVVTDRPEGFKALKIKIGRSKWMSSFEAALARDIEVTNAIRASVGPDFKLMVDANRDYWGRAFMALKYAEGVAASNVYFMEEMFPEDDVIALTEFKKRVRWGSPNMKLAAGESHVGGIAEDIYRRRVDYGDALDGPLIDVEQADMNAHGFLYLRAKAAAQARLGMMMAPHNFGSKLGFYAQVHLGMVTPNWDISEVDDSEFPAIVAEGVVLKDGLAKLTGAPGLGVTLREEHLQKPQWEI